MGRPSYLQIEVSAECNLRCPMCAINYRRDRRERPALMDFEVFCRIIDQCADAERSHLQGVGEPLMHPRFFDMVSYAAGRGILVTVNTNLTLLTRPMAERCVTAGLAEVYVSVDGARTRTYESIRVNARLSRLKRNLALLRQAREEIRGVRPRLLFVTVIMRRNLSELPDIVRLAGDSGAAEVRVQHLCHEWGTVVPRRYRQLKEFYDRETLMNDDLRRIERYFHRARAEAAARGIELHLPKAAPRRDAAGKPVGDGCGWPMRGVYINYRGDIMPCCMITTPERMNFGNTGRRGIGAVWESRRYRKFCSLLASRRPPPVCKSCSIYRGVF